MSGNVMRSGWTRLSNGYDVEFRHGVPIQVSDNGHVSIMPTSILIDEIASLGGLHTRLSGWQPGENEGEHVARLTVSPDEFGEVLRRLARSSAAIFVDRYHKPIGPDAVDWNRLEFRRDLGTALSICGLQRKQVNVDAYRDDYVNTMRIESQRLIAARESPPIEPE